ncbi:hypothetical protein [Algicola sagamiensis]|uniref:hypothetical protein n=1 Tax=Algicola sagamiensis TaxID=163869 RepID=UPI0003739034|nr:hypothetical protein [Algicola sagamiensis]
MAKFQWHWSMFVPLFGWIYLLIGSISPFTHPMLIALWWVDLFLSVVVHLGQIPLALRRASPLGFRHSQTCIYTFIFGATWWKTI